ncbi:Neuroguidin [Oopsacas minuta]|uniref:Neuroguidin n=1 Tax=Oopsacas minuta TaxID=111878 RepID=A0AAV7JP49_9METZ|nr:Neuroguidin [Oopsacas minuta]
MITKGEDEDIVAEHTPRFLELLSNIKTETDKAKEFVSSFHSSSSEDSALETQSEGISLLSLKSHLLLDYIINLTKVILHKLEAKPLSLVHSDVIDQLIKERVVLEKIKPLEMKTKYQIDKLVTLATRGSTSNHHPLSYKPNPSNLMPRKEGLSLGGYQLSRG